MLLWSLCCLKPLPGAGGMNAGCWEQCLWALGWAGHPHISLPSWGHWWLLPNSFHLFLCWLFTWARASELVHLDICAHSPGFPFHPCLLPTDWGVPEHFGQTPLCSHSQVLAWQTAHSERQERGKCQGSLESSLSLGAAQHLCQKHWLGPEGLKGERSMTCFLFLFPRLVPSLLE